jgi:hypothetical protein
MPIPRDKSLTAVVNVRVTEAEKADLREAAALAGLTVSEYVRRRALGRAVVARVDLAVLGELRRLGGLLKLTHTATKGAYAADTGAALVALRAYIDQLAAGGVDR